MEGLAVLVVVIFVAFKYSKAVSRTAEGLDAKATVWSSEIKVNAAKDMAAIDITEDTVKRANEVSSLIDQIRL
mgnify:FL=1